MREGKSKGGGSSGRERAARISELASPFLPYMQDADSSLRDRNSEEYIIHALANSPVPVPILIDLARRAGFEGLPLIELAARSSGNDGEARYRQGSLMNGTIDIDDRDSGYRASDRLAASRGAVPGLSEVAAGLDGKMARAFDSISSALGERRPQQLEMAMIVSRALVEGQAAFVEAGTGTGKSLGYLVPSVVFSIESGKRIVVSTHTKNLQSQLFEKEIVLLEDILGLEIQSARLFGRDNYICARRMTSEVAGIGSEDPAKALDLALYSVFSKTGRIDSIPSSISAKASPRIRAPVRCAMKGCLDAERCPLVRARKEAQRANVIFANHALVLADYQGGRSILGEYHGVIFDEAHHLERCVMENLSVKIRPGDLKMITGFVRPAGKQEEKWRFLINDLEISETGNEWRKKSSVVKDLFSRLEQAWEAMFASAEAVLNPDRALSGKRSRYFDGRETFGDINRYIQDYVIINKELEESLKPYYETSASPSIRSFQQEIETASKLLVDLRDAVAFLMEGDDEESVFWIEWNSRGNISSICGAPLSVDRRFADYLVDCCETAVFTSATLSQNGSFQYVKEVLGVGLSGKKVAELVEPSSFLRDDNCLILLHSDTGDPNEKDFAREISSLVGSIAISQGRRTLVLFTSYRMCFLAAEMLKEKDLPGPLLIQGKDANREYLSERFRSGRSSILFGLASFWEGVDFPGDELEILVITKIPFPVPDEPIVQARSERIKALGGNPFQELFIPQAVLRLRQGVGRLIRREDDRGVVILLDSRLHCRPYGNIILSSLPTDAVVISSTEEAVRRSLDWFEERPRTATKPKGTP